MKTGAYKKAGRRGSAAGNKRKLCLFYGAVLMFGAGFYSAAPLAPAFADEALNARIEQEKQRYIMQQASRCSIEQSRAGASEGSEDSSKAYEKCLKSYGIIHSYTKESFSPFEEDGGPFEELGSDGERFYGIIDTPDGKKEIFMEEEEFNALFTKDAQNLGMDDFFSLDDYGKEQLIKRLQRGQTDVDAGASPENRREETGGEETKSGQAPPRRVFRKPEESEGGETPSRVFRNFGR